MDKLGGTDDKCHEEESGGMRKRWAMWKKEATVYNIEEAVKGRKSIAGGDREDVRLKQRRGSWGEKWRKEKKRG